MQHEFPTGVLPSLRAQSSLRSSRPNTPHLKQGYCPQNRSLTTSAIDRLTIHSHRANLHPSQLLTAKSITRQRRRCMLDSSSASNTRQQRAAALDGSLPRAVADSKIEITKTTCTWTDLMLLTNSSCSHRVYPIIAKNEHLIPLATAQQLLIGVLEVVSLSHTQGRESPHTSHAPLQHRLPEIARSFPCTEQNLGDGRRTVAVHTLILELLLSVRRKTTCLAWQ